MKSVSHINIKKINEHQTNIYWTLETLDEIRLSHLIHDFQELIGNRFPKTFVITGEDIYNEDSFGGEVQKLLEQEIHVSTNVFYDSGDCYQKDSEVISTILELKRTDISTFAGMLSEHLFTYIFVYFANEETTVRDISTKLSNSKNFNDLENTLLSSGLIITPRLDGATMVIKSPNNFVKFVDDFLKEC